MIYHLFTHELSVELHMTDKKTPKLLQICQQVVARLLSGQYQNVFALLSLEQVIKLPCYKVDDGNKLIQQD